MKYTNASIHDIPSIVKLQEKYHVSTIKKEDKADGFVTTLFTKDQFEELILSENGLSIAVDGDSIVAYAMAASWHYWSAWPIFAYMIEDLPNIEFAGQTLSITNSYQYGPICIEKRYRGTKVLPNIFEFSRRTMMDKYPIMATFINIQNPRSYVAHTDKLGLRVIKTFEFNNNEYYFLAYDMSKRTRGSTLDW